MQFLFSLFSGFFSVPVAQQCQGCDFLNGFISREVCLLCVYLIF